MENSRLKSFIPLFYLVWSDDLLTQKEFVTLQEFIRSQNWLSKEEQEELLSKIDISTPPSREQLTKWKIDIEKSIQDKQSVKSIFDIVLALSGDDKSLKELEPVFTKLENDLGVFGEEAIGAFKKTATSFTSSYKTESSFDTKILTEILDGEQASIIKRVKSIINFYNF